MNRRQVVFIMLCSSVSPISFAVEASHAKLNHRDQYISLDFVSMPLRQLLQIMADMKGLNLVMSEKVAGKMTIHIKEAPWQEVLDTILASRSLLAKRKGSVLWVGPYEELMAHEIGRAHV